MITCMIVIQCDQCLKASVRVETSTNPEDVQEKLEQAIWGEKPVWQHMHLSHQKMFCCQECWSIWMTSHGFKEEYEEVKKSIWFA